MSLGTLYISIVDGEPRRTRVLAVIGLVKYFGIDVKISGPDEHFPSEFAIAKVPSFRHADGRLLTESLAISLFLLDQVPGHGGLLGDESPATTGQILSWMMTFNYDFMVPVGIMLHMTNGTTQFDQKKWTLAQESLSRVVPLIEQHLEKNTFLVGHTLTLADVYCLPFLLRPFQFFFGADWRKKHYGFTRWFNTVSASPYFDDFFKTFTPIEKVGDLPGTVTDA